MVQWDRLVEMSDLKSLPSKPRDVSSNLGAACLQELVTPHRAGTLGGFKEHG